MAARKKIKEEDVKKHSFTLKFMCRRIHNQDHSSEWSFYFAHKNRPLSGNSDQGDNKKSC